MRTELSVVGDRTGRPVTVDIAGLAHGTGPATWGQWAIRMAMLDMEPDDYGTNIKVVHRPGPPITVEAAVEAVRGLLTVYDSLRTRVAIQDDGTVTQHLDGEGGHDVHVFDAQDAAEIAPLAARIEAQWRAVRFDYAAEWPIRTALIRVDGLVHYVFFGLAHTGCDALGLTLVHQTYAALLAGADPLEVRAASQTLQPLEEAAYQASEKGQRRDRAARRYWRETLRTCPERMFVRRDGAPSVFRQALLVSPTLPPALDLLTERWSVGESAILLAAASAAVARHAGQDRCPLQVMVSNRFHPGLRGSLGPVTLEGLFVLDVEAVDFEGLVRRASRTAMSTYYHAYYNKIALTEDVRAVAAERDAGMDLTLWYNDLRGMIREARAVDRREERGDPIEKSTIEWQTLGDHSQTSLAWHLYQSSHVMPLTLTVDTGLIDETTAEGILDDFESLIVNAADAVREARV